MRRSGDGGLRMLTLTETMSDVGSEEAVADSPGGGFRSRLHAELGEDVADVGGGGTRTYEKRICNLRVGPAGDQQAQHFELAGRQAAGAHGAGHVHLSSRLHDGGDEARGLDQG